MSSVKLIFGLILCLVVLVVPTLSKLISKKTIEQAPGSEFLFAASISLQSDRHACTGVILKKRWIITSALCISEQNSNEHELKVYYGSHNRTHGQRKAVDIEKIVYHPEFNQRMLRNNVALMKIKSDIDFIPTVVDAAILPTKETSENDQASVIGWAQEHSDMAEMLMCKRTKIIPSNLCLSSDKIVANSDQVLCTRATDEDIYPRLDNGCALISSDGIELIGIATWYTDDFPNVFVPIQTHLPWIKSVILE